MVDYDYGGLWIFPTISSWLFDYGLISRGKSLDSEIKHRLIMIDLKRKALMIRKCFHDALLRRLC